MHRYTEHVCFLKNPVAWDANTEETGLMYLKSSAARPGMKLKVYSVIATEACLLPVSF